MVSEKHTFCGIELPVIKPLRMVPNSSIRLSFAVSLISIIILKFSLPPTHIISQIRLEKVDIAFQNVQ